MEDNLISSVKKAIRKWPAYIKYTEGMGIDPFRIQSIRELPVLEKKFVSNAISSVPLGKVRNIVPSSGTSGKDITFGLFGDTDLKKSSAETEIFLQKHFDTANKKTMILNLLPGAVNISSSTATVVSIGIRSDTAVYAIKTLGSSFEQIICVGEPLFIKNLIEFGRKQAVLWEYLPLVIIIGGEWVPESYRAYLEGIIGHQRIYSSMGMSELGLNYFYETDEMIMLRRLLFHDRQLMKLLFGNISFCPMLFTYNRDRIYVETIRDFNEELESILLTTTDSERIVPLIRYRTGDKGKIVSVAEFNRALRSAGYAEIIRETDSPIIAHFGRGFNISGIYPEGIMEIMYSSEEAASVTTGNFTLRNISNDERAASLGIQMKEGVDMTYNRENLYNEIFRELPLRVELYPYSFFRCPLDYERKVKYVGEGDHCRGREREEAELSVEI